jgi:hypothetical protein
MKVIFLDVDGVLNSYKAMPDKWTREDGLILHPRSLSMLEAIVSATQAEIVVSSTWRWHPKALGKLAEWLSAHQLHIYGITAQTAGHRSELIRDWLDAHGDITHHIILDDDRDADMEDGSLFHVDGRHGLSSLTPEQFNAIIEHLNRGDDEPRSA